MRRTTALTPLIALVLASPLAVAPASAEPGTATPVPDVLALPDGFAPEGVASGRGRSLYVGSLVDGAVWQVDARTGRGSPLVAGREGQVAVGIEVDRRDRLWVAGGPTGQARVYDARTGALLATYQLADAGRTFLNDVVVTRDAAYFTDSVNRVLHVVSLGGGAGQRLPDDATQLPLTGDLEYQQGFNANGIETTPDGDRLLVVQSNTGLLFSVDPDTGATTQVDLGGASLTFGDGLLRRGRTLYVVRNQLDEVAVVRLDAEARSGTVTGTLTDEDLDVPTTIARSGPSLYAVNARFGTPVTPETDYDVVRLPRR